METTLSFWSLLGPGDQHAFEQIAIRRSYPRGSVVYHSDDDAAGVLIIRDGWAKVSSTSPEGHESVLGFRGPGDLVGELSAIDSLPRSASVATLEPMTALVCATSRFRALVDSSPPVSAALMSTVVERLRQADAERADFGAHDVLGRVARRLCDLAQRFGSDGEKGIEITLPLTQEELAGWCGASREAVSKALTTMRDLGWIETHRRVVILTDAEKLRAYRG